MNNFIFQKKILTKELCDDIIEIFEETNNNLYEMVIPKKSKQWEKIEIILYKNLLMKIYEYKNELIIINKQQDILKDDLIFNLNKKLYIRHFKIRKYNNDSEILFIKNPNRYNLLVFILCLNNNFDILINNNIIPTECGNLILFPHSYNYKIKVPLSETQYIIYGELSYFEDIL